MRKLLSKLLVSVLLVTMVVPLALSGITVIAVEPRDSTYVLNGGTSAAKVGDKISIQVDITENPGIITSRFEIGYDDTKLKFVSYSNGSVFQLAQLTEIAGSNADDYANAEEVIRVDNPQNPVTVYFSAGAARRNITKTGTMITLNFEVIAEGSSEVTFNGLNSSGIDEEDPNYGQVVVNFNSVVAATIATESTVEPTDDPTPTKPPVTTGLVYAINNVYDASVGDVVEITVDLTNNPGILTSRFHVAYDETKLKFVSYSASDEVFRKTDLVEIYGSNLDEYEAGADVITVKDPKNPIAVFFSGGAASRNFTNTGRLITLRFEAIASGQANVTLTPISAFNVDGAELSGNEVQSTIYIDAAKPENNAAEELWNNAIEYMISSEHNWDNVTWGPEDANGQPNEAFPTIESRFTENGSYTEKLHIYCGAGATLTNWNVARFIQYMLEMYLTEAECIEDVTGLVAVTVPTDLSNILFDYGCAGFGQEANGLINIQITYEGDSYTVENYEVVIHKNIGYGESGYEVRFPWEPDVNAAEDLWELAIEYLIGTRLWASENWEEANGQPSAAFPSIESHYTTGDNDYVEKMHIYCGAGATLTNENVARFIQYALELYLIEAEGLGETIEDVAGLVTVTVPTDLQSIKDAYGGENNGGGAGGPINIEVTYEGDTYTVEGYEIVIHKNFDANNNYAVIFPWETEAITDLEITRLPDKVEYFVGENFDPSGMVVTAKFNNGNKITVSDYTIKGFDSSVAGRKTLTVTYGGLTRTFMINVISHPISEGSFVVSSVSGHPGDTVEVTVSVDKNPGLAGFNHTVSFDSTALQLEDVRMEGSFADGMFVLNEEQASQGKVTLTWFQPNDINENGAVYTLTFTILDGADGEYPISLEFGDRDNGNAAGEDVLFRKQDGKVTAQNYWLGDLTGDTQLSMKDILMLAQVVSGQSIELSKNQQLAADVNEDGEITIHDVILLSQWLLDRPIENEN